MQLECAFATAARIPEAGAGAARNTTFEFRAAAGQFEPYGASIRNITGDRICAIDTVYCSRDSATRYRQCMRFVATARTLGSYRLETPVSVMFGSRRCLDPRQDYRRYKKSTQDNAPCCILTGMSDCFHVLITPICPLTIISRDVKFVNPTIRGKIEYFEIQIARHEEALLVEEPPRWLNGSKCAYRQE